MMNINIISIIIIIIILIPGVPRRGPGADAREVPRRPRVHEASAYTLHEHVQVYTPVTPSGPPDRMFKVSAITKNDVSYFMFM